MKKPFNFMERSTTVFCANSKCSRVRGAEGVARAAIKKNVVARTPEGKPIFCYDCAHFMKTGETRSQRKAKERKRKASRVQEMQLGAVTPWGTSVPLPCEGSR